MRLTPVYLTSASGGRPSRALTASAMGWAVPCPILVVVLLIVLVAVFGPRWLRTRRRRRQEAEDARVAEAVARTLAEKEDVATPAG